MPAFTMGGTNKSIGIVVGGGWLPAKTSTPSVLATELTNLATEADLVSFGRAGSLESMIWTIAPGGGNEGSNVNNNLGPLAGAKVVLLSMAGKAVVLGGVTNGQRNVGMSFASLPVVDMTSGSVILQVSNCTRLNKGTTLCTLYRLLTCKVNNL